MKTLMAFAQWVGGDAVLRAPSAGLVLICLVFGMVPPAAAALMTPEQREELDLSGYTVRDRSAGLFDVAARRAWLKETRSPLIRAALSSLEVGMSCRTVMTLPVLNGKFSLPGFYPSPDSWELAAEPFFKFEDAVANLAGHYVVSGDPYYAECLGKLLARWADRDGFMAYEYTPASPQAWFAVEASLFAAGFAYATVRDELHRLDPGQARKIEDWLRRASERHVSFQTTELSCCNNHFYRRALHAAIIGIVSGSDELFQYGVSALYSALYEMEADGSLPREKRPSRGVHYQNYATLYLIMIMELVQRQGYPVYDLEVGGNTIHKLVNRTLDVLETPERVEQETGEVQDLWFRDDPQYFAWMEIYGARFLSERIEKLVQPYRPIYNRSAGGYDTLYFYRPTAIQEESEMALNADRAFQVSPDYCEKHPRWRKERDTRWRSLCEDRLLSVREGGDAGIGLPDPELVGRGEYR